jgi:hypothetical protein
MKHLLVIILFCVSMNIFSNDLKLNCYLFGVVKENGEYKINKPKLPNSRRGVYSEYSVITGDTFENVLVVSGIYKWSFGRGENTKDFILTVNLEKEDGYNAKFVSKLSNGEEETEELVCKQY